MRDGVTIEACIYKGFLQDTRSEAAHTEVHQLKLRLFSHPEDSLCTCMPKYSLNTYLGRCEHRCLYCYSVKFPPYQGRTEPNLSLPANINEMAKNTADKLPVMISPATDPYQPSERHYNITRTCIEALASHAFPLLIVTKSSLVTQDIDIFKQSTVAVAMSVTTLDEEKAKIIETGASPPRQRVQALETLRKSGIAVVARIDPIIPTFTDGEDELKALVSSLVKVGVQHVTVSTLKPIKGFFSSLKQVSPELFRELAPLYQDGKWIQGYRYLPARRRREIIVKAGELVANEGLTFSSCREGFKDLNTSLCDGTAYLRGQM